MGRDKNNHVSVCIRAELHLCVVVSNEDLPPFETQVIKAGNYHDFVLNSKFNG